MLVLANWGDANLQQLTLLGSHIHQRETLKQEQMLTLNEGDTDKVAPQSQVTEDARPLRVVSRQTYAEWERVRVQTNNSRL